MTTALFIGRFQPFHNGHYNALQSARKQYDRVIVGVGSAQHSHAPDNPLSLEERKQVITNCFPDIEIVGIRDRDDDDDWMDWIEANITFDVGISGNDHVRRIFTGRGHEIRHPDYLQIDYFSGTAIRDAIVNEQEWQDRVPDCSQAMLNRIGFAERVKAVRNET